MKMNLCPDKERLIAYRSGILNPAEQKLIEEHITQCKKCQRELKIELEIDKCLSTAFDPGPIEDSVIQRLRLDREISARIWWSYPVWVFLNTLAFLALGLGVWVIINQPYIISKLNDFVNLLPKNSNAIIMNVISILFLLMSLAFSFRKKFLRYLIEL